MGEGERMLRGNDFCVCTTFGHEDRVLWRGKQKGIGVYEAAHGSLSTKERKNVIRVKRRGKV